MMSGREAKSSSVQPTLLIVMGTSGSGKSTVGSALSEALSCPFVDGDDLHPASNVEKMSQGHALNDSDREPWLKRIRETGLQLTTASTVQPQKRMEEQKAEQGGDDQVRKLAEVYETSQQESTTTSHAASTAQKLEQTGDCSSNPHPAAHMITHQVAVIACSALKLVYRQLIRGSITSLSQQSTAPESVPSDLKVIHVYLNLSRQLLEQRMADRKGHFMKLDMLYSQLDTLQAPSPDTEPNVIVINVQQQSSTQNIIESIQEELSHLHVP